MAAESLRDELMELAGVADAEVDDDADSPTGVRVRLEPDADARLVGAEVQRVLASHGLRSRISDTPDDEPAQDPDGDGDEPDVVPDGAVDEASEEAAGKPVTEPSERMDVPPLPEIPPPPIVAPPTTPPPDTAEPVVLPAADPAGEGVLSSITLEEWPDRVEVTATAADGRTVTQRSEATEAGTFAAAVAAVGTLADGTPPELLSVTPIEADGASVLTVALRRPDGSTVAGAAVVNVAAPYAVGRATWIALRG